MNNTVSIPSSGECVYILHNQHSNCKAGNSGAACTLLLPNSLTVTAHAVHLGIVAGQKGVSAALKEGISPHVRISKLGDSNTQAIVRLLMPEGVTQQRHSALRLPDVTVNHR